MNLYDYAELLMTTDKQQCFNRLTHGDRCCAMGLLAIKTHVLYAPNISVEVSMLMDDFISVTNERVTLLNDHYKWSFPRIGEYLLCFLLPE